jgi:hypothetical protein
MEPRRMQYRLDNNHWLVVVSHTKYVGFGWFATRRDRHFPVGVVLHRDEKQHRSRPSFGCGDMHSGKKPVFRLAKGFHFLGLEVHDSQEVIMRGGFTTMPAHNQTRTSIRW